MTTQQMRVDNTAFLIEKLASDCSPNQYIRELTANAIQAIEARAASGWKGIGKVIWDVDWNLVEDTKVYKLQISDNGTGMTGSEIEQYINHLSSSGRIQNRSKNFGLGAKITACVQNPAGLLYKSWVNGIGTMAHLWKDPESGYGLKQLPLGNDRFAHFAQIVDEAKCDPIDTCGTSVLLLGSDLGTDDTFMPGVGPSKWLVKYLNDRYFDFPANIKLKVRHFDTTDRSKWPASMPEPGSPKRDDDEEGGSQFRTIRGMKFNLGKAAQSSGIVELKDAKIHWWLLPDEVSQKDIWESAGHCAALYQGELYDFLRSHAGRSRLREFGVVFGTSRVVLYAEPNDQVLQIYANTSRSGLLCDRAPLPWNRWAAEFRDAIPAPIQNMMDALVSKSGDRDHRDTIRKRLKEIRDLLRPSRYRRTPGGPVTVGGELPGGESNEGPPRGTGASASGTRGGTKGSLYGSYIKAGGIEAELTNATDDIPMIRWISNTDGTRERGDLDDRAARYLPEENLLTINADFRVFHDLTKRCSADHNPSGDTNRETEIREVVREWVGLQLVEAVVSITSLEGSMEWGTDVIRRALSPEALTTAALPRYVMLKTINRALGQRFGKKTAPEEI